MKTKQFATLFFSGLIGTLILFSGQAFATSIMYCNLYDVCPLFKGNKVYFHVTPSSGNYYGCDIKSNGGKLTVWLSGNSEYKISGGGIKYANPYNSLFIRGQFKHPENPYADGQIQIDTLSWHHSGFVTCYPLG